MNRRHFLSLGLGATGASLIAAALPGTALAGGGGAPLAAHLQSVTALTEVFGEGQKVTAAILKYDAPILNSSLKRGDYAVAGRTVTRVYASVSPDKAPAGQDGPYVIVELSRSDASAGTRTTQGFTSTLAPAHLSVQQVAPVRTATGAVYAPFSAVPSRGQRDLIVEDFQQLVFTDAQTGIRQMYNLYVPKAYDPARKYPLVLFMPDATATSSNPIMTLVQGDGATVWATPEAQAKHPAFVLAPQFDQQPVINDSQPTPYVDTVARLVQKVAGEYSIDPARLYTTGQSGGCMMSLALDIKYPTLFAASYLVAGQWDASKVAPMARQQLWIMVSQGDAKAYPGMNAITAALEKAGAKVARAVWNGRASPAQLAQDVAALRQQDANVRYVALQKGTVVPAGQEDNALNNHLDTWRIAYEIPGIRDWLFAQHL